MSEGIFSDVATRSRFLNSVCVCVCVCVCPDKKHAYVILTP